MDTLIGVLTWLSLSTACVGYGNILAECFSVQRLSLSRSEYLALCFICGSGLWGWFWFPIGVLSGFSAASFWLGALAGNAALALPGMRHFIGAAFRSLLNERRGSLLLPGILLLIVLGLDGLEGISPPADGDTLAYHAAIAKNFAAWGRIEFLPTALTGAIPLLPHVVYSSALSMGGELALTLWLMISGWAPALLLYGFASRYVGSRSALLLALLLLTTPAVLYGGGAGQIEMRAAGFVFAAVILLAEGTHSKAWKPIALAGAMAGFFAASKYFGLIFVGAAGIAGLLWIRRPLPMVAFAALAACFGCEWYLWNYINTGDPAFPMLFSILSAPDLPFWTARFSESFAPYFADAEKSVPLTLINWVLYPVLATFLPAPGFESSRTGFGLYLFLVLPLAAYGAYRIWRKNGVKSDYFMFILICSIFYTIWFFFGSTLRIRHLLPVYPLLLVAFHSLAAEGADNAALSRPFGAAIYLALAIQIAGQIVFSANYAKYVFSGETRQGFLERNVGGANAAFWINEHLSPSDKVGFVNRELAYLFDVPSFFVVPYYQMLIDFRPNTAAPGRFAAQAKKNGITHLLFKPVEERIRAKTSVPENFRMLGELAHAGCLREVRAFDVPVVTSRALSVFRKHQDSDKLTLYEMVYSKCPG